MPCSRLCRLAQACRPPKDGAIEIDTSDQDFELDDYSTGGGQLELENVAGDSSKLRDDMSALLQTQVIPSEVRAPLPRHLKAAQEEGMADLCSEWGIAAGNSSGERSAQRTVG